MTVTMLLVNTIASAERAARLNDPARSNDVRTGA